MMTRQRSRRTRNASFTLTLLLASLVAGVRRAAVLI